MFQSTVWATIGVWVQQLFAFIAMMVLARMLDPVAFGVVALATLFTLFSQRILLECFGFAIIQRMHITEHFSNATFFVAIVTALIFSIMMNIIASPLGKILSEPSLPIVLSAFSVIPLLDGLACVQNAMLRRDMRYKALAVRTMGANFAGAATAVGMALLGFGVYSLVAQQLIVSIGSVLALWFVSTWRPTRTAYAADFREVAAFAVPMLGSTVLQFATSRLDIMVVAGGFGAAAAGMYSLAKRINRLMIDLLVSGLNNVSQSQLARMRRDGQDLNKIILRQSSAVALILSPIFVGMFCLSAEFVAILLGVKWTQSVELIRLLSATGSIQALSISGTYTLVALGYPRSATYVSTVGLLILAVLIAMFWPLGTLGVALAVCLQPIALLAFLLRELRQTAGMDVRAYVRNLVPILLANIVLALALATTRPYIIDELGVMLGVFALILFGVGVYLALAVTLMRDIAADIFLTATRSLQSIRPVQAKSGDLL